MTGIERNGIEGLCLKVAVIALAVIAFGCAPKLATRSAQVAPIATTPLNP